MVSSGVKVVPSVDVSGVCVREIYGASGGRAESRKSRSIYVLLSENKAPRAYARRGLFQFVKEP